MLGQRVDHPTDGRIAELLLLPGQLGARGGADDGLDGDALACGCLAACARPGTAAVGFWFQWHKKKSRSCAQRPVLQLRRWRVSRKT